MKGFEIVEADGEEEIENHIAFQTSRVRDFRRGLSLATRFIEIPFPSPKEGRSFVKQLGWVLVIIVLAVLAYRDAESRGMSWLFIVYGVLGLIVYLAVRKVSASIAPAQATMGERKRKRLDRDARRLSASYKEDLLASHEQ